MKSFSFLIGGAVVSTLLATSAIAGADGRLDRHMLALHSDVQPLDRVDRLAAPAGADPLATITGGPSGGLPDRN